jgi:hypothetical protein
VPTVFFMILNGMLLGVFAAIHHQAGIRAEMWAWLLPHGITELGAIILCGGVGLMLGRAVVRPGSMSRTQSLRYVGREAALVCIGAAGMLIVAATSARVTGRRLRGCCSPPQRPCSGPCTLPTVSIESGKRSWPSSPRPSSRQTSK